MIWETRRKRCAGGRPGRYKANQQPWLQRRVEQASRPNRDEEDKATTSTTMDLADARLYPRITASHMRAEKAAEGWQDLVLKIGVC